MFSQLWAAFVLGLLTPLTAACVLPLYPGFLSYLSNQLTEKSDKKTIPILGVLVVTGVISFMLLVGLVFTTLFQVSLTNFIQYVSPSAFLILLVISLFLIFNFDFSKLFKMKTVPLFKNPKLSAFVYGFFFGAIVIPCNPAFIGAFFARALIVMGFLSKMLQFLAFGAGLGAPLLLFSLISLGRSGAIISWLSNNKKWINRVSGIIMFVVSFYYLVFVFKVL